MITSEAKAAKLHELEERYTGEGFEVVRQPGPGDVPFELFGYRPDLLARKEEQHLLIDVRTPGLPLPMEQMAEVAREVRKLPGWRYHVFTLDDVPEDAPGVPGPLPAWPELRRRVDEAVRLAQSCTSPEAAVLALWSAVEGMLRKKAEDAGIPVERKPLPSLLGILYSMHELTLQQHDALRAALGIRGRLIHGYGADAREVAAASRRLVELAQELLRPRVDRAA